MMGWRAWTHCCLFVAAGGCRADEPGIDPGRYAVVDAAASWEHWFDERTRGAGVVAIETASTKPLSLVAVPTPQSRLLSPDDFAALPGRLIAVLHRGADQVHLFDGGGAHLQTLAVPGDLGNARQMIATGPDLAVLVHDRDPRTRGLLPVIYAGSTTGFARHPAPQLSPGSTLLPTGRGILVAEPVHAAEDAEAARFDSVAISAWPEGDGQPPLITYPTAGYRRLGPSGMHFPPVAAPRPRHAATDSAILVHGGTRYRIGVFDHEGAARSILYSDVKPEPTAEADVEEWLAAQRGEWERSRQSSELERRVATVRQHGHLAGRAAVRPILGVMLASPEGHLLVERLDLSRHLERARVWDLISPAAKLMGRIETDASLNLTVLRYPVVYGTADRSIVGYEIVNPARD